MARRVQTEQVFDERYGHQGEDDAPPYNLEELSDDDAEPLYGEEDDYGQEQETKDNNRNRNNKDEGAGGAGGGDDLINYKGIYFNDDQGQKYTDPDNGAHFEFRDMCKRLTRIQQKRMEMDKSESGNATQQIENIRLSMDPQQQQKLALQKEKEEFLKSLGMSKQQKDSQTAAQLKQQQQLIIQKQQQQIQQEQKALMEQIQKQKIIQQQQEELMMQQQYQQMQQQIAQDKANKQQQALQQHSITQQQQQNLAMIQQQMQSSSKWRSKSNEKQNFMLSNTQKIVNKAKVLDLNQQATKHPNQINKFGTKMQTDNQNALQLLQRGKTPENLNKLKVQALEQNLNQAQQNIQKMKAQLGYNDSQISTSSNIPQQQQQQQQQQTNKTSSQRSTRDKISQIKTTSKIGVYNVGSGPTSSHSRNGAQTSNTFQQIKSNKSQTMKKQGMASISKHLAPEIDSLMLKFNNSIAVQQQTSSYGPTSSTLYQAQKSRNINPVGNSFKTASIGSTKAGGSANQHISKTLMNNGVGYEAKSRLSTNNNPNNGIPMIVTADPLASNNLHGKKSSNSGKFNQTVAGSNQSNLYSMIYQNRQKNLVSSYLNGLNVNSQQLRSSNAQISTKVQPSSRNKNLMAPLGTKNKTRNNVMGGGTLDINNNNNNNNHNNQNNQEGQQQINKSSLVGGNYKY